MGKHPLYRVHLLGYATYGDYLRSEHWQNVKRRYYKSKRKRRHECYICRSTDKQLDLHHKSYLRIGRERPQDLIPLCRDCHGLVHERQPSLWALWNTHKQLRRDREAKAA